MFQIEFDNDKVVGIDLGTTNSLVAWMNLTKPEVIGGDDGDKLVPSVVSVSPGGEIVVGNKARQELIDHPDPQATHQDKNLTSKFPAIVLEHAFASSRRSQQDIAILGNNFDQYIARLGVHIIG